MDTLSAVRAARRSPLLQLVKTAIATVGAWLLTGTLIPEGPPPVFAAIAALLVVQPSLNQSYLKAIERSAGVIVGVVVASLIAWALPEPAWSLPLAIVAALAVAWTVRMTAGSTNQVVISALLVIAMGASTPGYAVDRAVETVIGAALGFVVNLVLVPPVAVAPARRSLESLGEELASSLERLADALIRPLERGDREELLITARLLRPMRERTDAALLALEESLTLNPRGRRHREELAELTALRDRFGPVATQTIGMTRAFYDHYDDAIADDPIVQDIAEQLRRAAHDVRYLTHRSAHDGDASATQDQDEAVPALTSPLRVLMPTGSHWVLIGSLLEDLRRVHEELTAREEPEEG